MPHEHPYDPSGRTPPKVPRPGTSPRALSPVIARLLARSSGDLAREAQALIESFEKLPHVEPTETPGECVVTFFWRDPEAEEVLLFANRVTDERNLPASLMERLPGTDIWHIAYRMRSDWRASYSFHSRLPGQPWLWGDGSHPRRVREALDAGFADPGNPEVCLNRMGTRKSVVALPDAPPQPWLAHRSDLRARGTVIELVGPDGRPVWLYEPPVESKRSEQIEQTTPVVVVLDGEVWSGQTGSAQDAATTVDNLIADRQIRPCILVMPHSGGRERRWEELDSTGEGADWIVDRLLPWVRAITSASDNPDDVIVAGQSLGAYTALRVALERPEAVGAVLSQSASLWQRRLPTPNPALIHRLHAYIEVGAQEWVLREPNHRAAAALAEVGADVHDVEFNGGHDYACWRGGLADGLRVLLGPPAVPA